MIQLSENRYQSGSKLRSQTPTYKKKSMRIESQHNYYKHSPPITLRNLNNSLLVVSKVDTTISNEPSVRHVFMPKQTLNKRELFVYRKRTLNHITHTSLYNPLSPSGNAGPSPIQRSAKIKTEPAVTHHTQANIQVRQAQSETYIQLPTATCYRQTQQANQPPERWSVKNSFRRRTSIIKQLLPTGKISIHKIDALRKFKKLQERREDVMTNLNISGFLSKQKLNATNKQQPELGVVVLKQRSESQSPKLRQKSNTIQYQQLKLYYQNKYASNT